MSNIELNCNITEDEQLMEAVRELSDNGALPGVSAEDIDDVHRVSVRLQVQQVFFICTYTDLSLSALALGTQPQGASQ
jgi:hypothetical protein